MICYLKFYSSFHFCSQNQLNIYRNISAGPAECLAFRLFLNKVPNMYVNLKKKIEISHLRGSVVIFIHKTRIYFTASYRRILSAGNLNN